MFGNILGKKKTDNAEQQKEVDPKIVERISRMNLSDMRIYVKNGLKEFLVTSDGLHEVLKKLVDPSGEKDELYIKTDDMDTKKKKAFELILLIANSKKISLENVEMIQKFIETYKEIIDDYDTKNKDIYSSRLKKAIETAIVNVQTITHLQKRLDVLH